MGAGSVDDRAVGATVRGQWGRWSQRAGATWRRYSQPGGLTAADGSEPLGGIIITVFAPIPSTASALFSGHTS